MIIYCKILLNTKSKIDLSPSQSFAGLTTYLCITKHVFYFSVHIQLYFSWMADANSWQGLPPAKFGCAFHLGGKMHCERSMSMPEENTECESRLLNMEMSNH